MKHIRTAAELAAAENPEATVTIHASALGRVAPSHTPGPWTLGRTSKYAHAIFATDEAEQEAMIASVVGPRHLPQEIHINASLIAAAPDMLAALRDVLAIGYIDEEVDADGDSFASEVKRRVRAAIAKAEGL